MSLTIPPAVNYASPLISLPVVWDRPPTEGSRIVPCEIDWGTMGGADNCLNLNIYGGAAQTISQIAALSVDNSGCSADVVFIFPDTAQTYAVKALTPVATFGVFTNQTQFYVSAPKAAAGDVTRFGVLNSFPYPVSLAESPVPPPVPESAVFNAIPVAAGDTQIVPAGVNGTINAIAVAFQFTSTACNVQWSIVDGSGKTICGGQAAASPISNDNIYIISYNQSGLDQTFTNGLSFNMTLSGSGINAFATVNVHYTVP